VPYVRCARCGLTSFSVAGWSHVDQSRAAGPIFRATEARVLGVITWVRAS
jgi:hypothetical protein